MPSSLNKMRLKRLVLTAFIVSLSWAGVVHAHGLVTSQEQEHKEYIVEFEYSKLDPVKAGEYAHYGVYLLDSQTREEQDFESAIIRIQKPSGEMVLAGTVSASREEKGKATIGGVLPEAGEYVASVSFLQGNETLVSAEFPLTIEPAIESVDKKNLIVWGISTLIVIVAVNWAIRRFLNKKNYEDKQ